MFFNLQNHSGLPFFLYDGNGNQIRNATEIDTQTGMGKCWLDLEKLESWPRLVVFSLEKYVGASIVEAKCQWSLPIRVTSLSGCELKNESQLMVAIKYDRLKKRIEKKFNDLAEKQRKAFHILWLKSPWIPKDDIQANFR